MDLQKVDGMLRNTDSVSQLAAFKQYAETFFKSKCFSKNITNVEQAIVIMMHGASMGFSFIESMNSFYLVNGNINLYGDALIKVLTRNGYKITYKDEVDSNSNPIKCTATVRSLDGKEEYVESATIKEVGANRAFKIAPKEKLRYHAVRQIIKFNLPHLVSLQPYEESVMEEISDTPNPTTGFYADTVQQIQNVKSKEELALLVEKISGVKDEIPADLKDDLRNQLAEKLKHFEAVDVEPVNPESNE